MKIYLLDQSANFAKHLDQLKRVPVMAYEQSQLTEKTSAVTVRINKNLEALNTDFLFDYQIFPSHIMSHACEWKLQQRAMQEGDTIVQQICLPPTLGFSQKLIFGVRICQILKKPGLLSFSYETLEGHVEKGRSTFSLIQTGVDKIEIRIHTFSKPGHFLSKLVGPIFSIPYQNYCTKQALIHMRSQLEP